MHSDWFNAFLQVAGAAVSSSQQDEKDGAREGRVQLYQAKGNKVVGRGGGGWGGRCQKISQKHLEKKKNVQEKMWISMQYEHQKTHKQNENVTNLKKKPPHVPLAAGARTRTQTHPDTGIKFLVKIH